MQRFLNLDSQMQGTFSETFIFQEFPFVRYRAAKSLDPMTMTTFRDLIPTKLAAGIWNCLVKYKSIPNFPQNETCELLILDRSIDQVFILILVASYDICIVYLSNFLITNG